MVVAWRKFKYRLRSRKRVRRHSCTRRHGLRPAAILTLIGVIIILSAWGLNHAGDRLEPVIDELAISKLSGIVTTAANKSVQELMETQGLSYDQLVNRHTNSDGAVTSLTMDYVAVNKLKSAIALSIHEEISKVDSTEVSVPLGAFFSDNLMVGFGVGIPIKTIASERIDVSFNDTFEAAGINQTRHMIEIVVKAPISIVSPMHKTTAEVTTQIPIAETVIVGSVPNTYLDLGK